MSIIKFLEENKDELYVKLLELGYVWEEDDEEDNIELMFEKGCYEKGNALIETEEICCLWEGCDVSFKRKFVKKIYDDDDSVESEFEFKGKKIYCLRYNV